ncbi:alkaline phosphatase family protein [Nocardioides terrigena]|uniref:alkaline phosphatase family protein n=1 Tax=Nocardioides terrigena TaxID=424797 RepID=UPI000D2FF184|nr:alkaline phosphatase family protein [Nocardioides terrigena]
MSRPRTIAAITTALVVAAVGAAAGAGAQASGPGGMEHGPRPPERPTKVVIIVVDSLSREIVDTYDMRNVETLMRDGVDTPRGYLGHTGSVTVVTHNVITSGQLPKHMGWTDEGYRDVDGLLGDPEPDNPDQLYITSNATTDLLTLQEAAGYPKLADYLGAADPDAKTFTISPKGYAAYAFGGAGSDSIITFGSGPECTTGGSWRKPTGVNVPSYILGEPCSRFWVHSGYPAYAYDTAKLPAVLYPLDSDRYVTGKDPAHQGGDVWAADAAVEVMRNDPSWNGIFVSLPGVDKAAHMWGGTSDPGPTGADGDPMTHMAAATAEADRQVAKILAELEAQDELDNTLVVLTSDHGSVAGDTFHGELVAEPNYGFFNWYYGDPENDEVYDRPQAALQPLVDTDNIGLTYSDSMLRVWLKDQSPAAVKEAAAAMRTMADVTAVWRRDGDHYDRVSRIRWDRMDANGERSWFGRKAQELVDTQAADYGPDLIATLPDNTTYSVAGDHGGIQRAAQQVPIVFAGAGLSAKDLRAEVRSVDIMPTVLRAMGIEPTFPMDGVAYRLPSRR